MLPASLRLASGLNAAVVIPLITLYVLVSAQLVTAAGLPGAGEAAMWTLAAFFALGTVMNVASRSKIERIWGPLSLALTVCCLIIALRA